MFFKQTFKIFFDNGTIVETDNLLSYVNNSLGGAEVFYYRMKWLCVYEKSSFWNKWYYNSYDTSFYYPTFYLYTKNNVMISPELFRNEYIKQHYRIYYNSKRYKRNYLHKVYRKRHTTTYERQMKTISERRAVAAVLKDDNEPEFRGKRRKLPDPWDEIIVRKSLSWKDCTKRKKQYKGS